MTTLDEMAVQLAKLGLDDVDLRYLPGMGQVVPSGLLPDGWGVAVLGATSNPDAGPGEALTEPLTVAFYESAPAGVPPFTVRVAVMDEPNLTADEVAGAVTRYL